MTKTKWMLAMAALAAAATGQTARAQWQIPAEPAARPAYVAQLMATAQKGDAPLSERFAACRELAVWGGPAAVPVLAALLGDEKMSHMARYGLEPIPGEAVDEALRAALGKVQGKALTGVIDSIGVRKDAGAVGALSGLLGAADPEVVAAAAMSLGRIGNAEAAASLEKALAGAAGAALEALADGCLRAADALCGTGQAAAAIGLYDRVRGSQVSKPLRMAGVHGAILTRGREGLPLLLEMLRGKDDGMAAAALRVAYELSGPELSQALAAELPKLPAERQGPVLQALGNRQDAAALPAVLAAAKSGPANIRVAAVRAAGQLACPSCLPLLLDLCIDPETEVAAAAQAVLAGFPGAEADDAVLKQLSNPDPKVRLIAVDLIGQRRLTAALPALLQAAEDPGKQVSGASLKMLGELGGAAEIPALIALLAKSPSGQVENALAAVCAREGTSSAGLLCGALAEVPVPARQALLRTLSAAGGGEALAAVRAATKEAVPEMADTATRVLCDWPGSEAAADQLALAKTSANPTCQVLALRGYIRAIGDARLSANQRQAMCQEAGALIKREAETKLLLSALGNSGDAASLPLVMSHLGNPATAEESVAAAVAIAERIVAEAPAPAAEAMKTALKSTSNAALQQRARRVLAQARPKPAAAK